MRIVAFAISIVFVVACDSPDNAAPGGTGGTVSDGSATGNPDAATDTTEPRDEGPSVADTTPPTGDTGPIPADPGNVFDPGPAPDLLPDKEPPFVTATKPAKEALDAPVPFVVEITFNEPVRNVVDKTAVVYDQFDEPLEGAWATPDGKDSGPVWVFTPAKPDLIRVVSPYRVQLNLPVSVISDLAGNKLEGPVVFTFVTEGPKNTVKYTSLASKYAPLLRQETQDTGTVYDYPLALNTDGDWDATNTKAWMGNAATKQVLPTVQQTVIESESHFFIHYAYYWPFRPDWNGTTFENDAAGAMVVVEKWAGGVAAERPVEVLTWFRDGSGEYIRAYPTTESGILAAGGDAADLGVDAVYDQAVLFPANRFEAWVSAGTHQSCLWADPGSNGFINTCMLSATDKVSKTFFELAWGAQATPIVRGDPKWPRTGNASYALVDLLGAWWARRTAVGKIFFDQSRLYTLKIGDTEWTTRFPTWFVSGADKSDGRPPWAARWEPGDGKKHTKTESGVFFVDPAGFLALRHKEGYVKAAWDPTTKEGFAVAYCYNPYLGIDRRGTIAACP